MATAGGSPVRQQTNASLSGGPLLPAGFDHEDLHHWEIRWRDRQLFLESRGYMLRTRLRPGWSPSWFKTGQDVLHAEDAVRTSMRQHLIDATRISDGRPVYIKRIQTGDNESTIAMMLNTEALRRDPRNHSVPILDMFPDDDDPSISYMVMPFLRLFVDPEFDFIGEVLDAGEQLLEGLVFLHENGVAHRDCAQKNLLFDASAMYPNGFHPINTDSSVDMTGWAQHISRLSAGPRYYYVDYGISTLIPPGGSEWLVTGTYGRDQDVPELSDEVPYDPFKVDVFILGNMFRQELYMKYGNLGFMKPIVDAMTQYDPDDRPSAQQVLDQWRRIRRKASAFKRHWRVSYVNEPILVTLILDAIGLVRVCIHFFKWLSGHRYPGS